MLVNRSVGATRKQRLKACARRKYFLEKKQQHQISNTSLLD